MKTLQQYLLESNGHKVLYIKYLHPQGIVTKKSDIEELDYTESPLAKSGITLDKIVDIMSSRKKLTVFCEKLSKKLDKSVEFRSTTNPTIDIKKYLSKDGQTSTVQILISSKDGLNFEEQYLYCW